MNLCSLKNQIYFKINKSCLNTIHFRNDYNNIRNFICDELKDNILDVWEIIVIAIIKRLPMKSIR